MSNKNHYSTRAVHSGEKNRPFHALTTPIVQTSTFTFDDTADLVAYKLKQNQRIEYGRYGNPTVEAVENKLEDLDHGEAAILFSSGMAAITLTFLTFLSNGDHMIITDDCYRRTREFATMILPRYGIEATLIPMGDFTAMEDAIQPNTKLIFSESPTNPYLRILDLESLVKVGEKYGIMTAIDSTFATPINQRPLEFGVDLVLHSATKYLGGHNDLLAGVAVGTGVTIEKLRETQNIIGAICDPQAAYLLLRGIKTLPLRMTRHNETGLRVARFLESHPRVRRVYYPGLSSHPDFSIASQQMDGYGGVVSFDPKGDMESTSKFIDSLRIPQIGPSLGGVESLVIQVSVATYYEMTTEERAAIGISDSLVRLAVGVEDAEDLIEDLDQALEACL
ncbi:MAG: aminotransferase class I/II-fold pyridoxal phosphate-dependent enzyme [Anaerolineales bacterium]|nr:aminotransferase class I/II-fold pyridoxal phosphate-dependent enzyme [Anaerolineales bacterium]